VPVEHGLAQLEPALGDHELAPPAAQVGVPAAGRDDRLRQQPAGREQPIEVVGLTIDGEPEPADNRSRCSASTVLDVADRARVKAGAPCQRVLGQVGPDPQVAQQSAELRALRRSALELP
jgi:hypothetical protein